MHVFLDPSAVPNTIVKRAVSDALYSGIPGASFQNVNGLGPIWIIPCTAEVNLTFKIGGQAYPIHPLDTNSADAFNDGQTCVGAVRFFDGCFESPHTQYSNALVPVPALHS
jgi:hypothetical protein